jgi:hypothetical protein
MTASTFTITPFNNCDIADIISTSVKAGNAVTVNGVAPVSAWGSPAAKAWNNGTLSITAPAKAKGKFKDVFFKTGTTVTVTWA